MTERIIARSLVVKSHFVSLSHNLNLLCAVTDEASDVLRRMKHFFGGGVPFQCPERGYYIILCNLAYNTL